MRSTSPRRTTSRMLLTSSFVVSKDDTARVWKRLELQESGPCRKLWGLFTDFTDQEAGGWDGVYLTKCESCARHLTATRGLGLGRFRLSRLCLRLHSAAATLTSLSCQRSTNLLLDSMKHRAFEVFIRGHSNRLPEFDVKLEDPHTMTCFIPSESGQVSGNPPTAVCV